MRKHKLGKRVENVRIVYENCVEEFVQKSNLEVYFGKKYSAGFTRAMQVRKYKDNTNYKIICTEMFQDVDFGRRI